MTLRIYGPELDDTRTYVDADIGTYNLDGTVELTDKNTSDTWTVPATNLHDWDDKDLLVHHDDITEKNHTLWKVVDDLRANADSTEFAGAEGGLLDETKEIFIILCAAAKGEG